MENSHQNYFVSVSFGRKELIVIFSLCITLLLCIVSKYIVDYHWNTPNIEVIQPLRVGVRFQLDINKAEWYEQIGRAHV